jgi:xanthine dehydrogenase accessory factor
MSTNFNDGSPKASRGFFADIAALQRAGERAALASPARLSGSVPCGGQSRMLVRADGSTRGTVGGGLLEAQVLHQAAAVMEKGEPSLLEFELTQEAAADAGMMCGGSCTVLIEPVLPGRDADVFAAAALAEAEGTDIVMVTLLPDHGATTMLAFLPDGAKVGWTGDATVDAKLRELAQRHGTGEQPCMVTEPLRACIQPVRGRPAVFVFGAGHVAVPVVQIAALAGFRVTVVDDRGDLTDSRRFPLAERILATPVEDAFGICPIGAEAYVLAITRGHVLDEEVVAHALKTSARYIGMIGSRRKVASVLDLLRDRGFGPDDIARVHAPIGLDIGAETVEEIAVSIVAEMVAVRRGRDKGR